MVACSVVQVAGDSSTLADRLFEILILSYISQLTILACLDFSNISFTHLYIVVDLMKLVGLRHRSELEATM